MNDSTSGVLGGAIAAVAVVLSVALMADCSKSVSRTGSEAVEACVRSGGQWVGSNDGNFDSLDHCIMPKARQ